MNILYVNCSPRQQASESRRLGGTIVEFLQRSNPGSVVVNRSLGDGAPAHIDKDYADALGAAAVPQTEPSDQGSLAASELLIRELEQAEVLVIATPMHNFTVPSALKAWIDHIVRVHRTFDLSSAGKVGKLRDRPVFVAVSAGGRFSGEQARQPNFLTPYLKAVLGVIGLHDLTFFWVEGTAFGPDALSASRFKAHQAIQNKLENVQLRFGHAPLAEVQK